MPTDAVLATVETETSQARGFPISSRAAADFAGAMMQAWNVTKFTETSPPTLGTVIAVCQAPKVSEINRQIGRLKEAKALADSDAEDGGDVESVVSSISFLENLAVGPIPVPIASWEHGAGSSLFFNQGGFYGDLEIIGRRIEYLLTWQDGDQLIEVYDTENMESGKIPPRLLVHLFEKFARVNAEVL
jgi:hypothetical protein